MSQKQPGVFEPGSLGILEAGRDTVSHSWFEGKMLALVLNILN